MSAEKTSEDRGGSLLHGLLAPLRIPERAIEALESLAEVARELGAARVEVNLIREHIEPLGGLMPAVERVVEHAERVPELLAVAERISRQAEPLAELLPSLERVEESLGGRIDALHETVGSLQSEETHLNQRVGELLGDLRAMHETVTGLTGDVEKLTNRMLDPDRGPLEKARDFFTSDSE